MDTLTSPAEDPTAAITERRNIYDLAPSALSDLMKDWGEPAYRAKQVLQWLYRETASDFQLMTNLPASLRGRLAQAFAIGSAELVAQKVSSDGWTRKMLLKLRDGNTIEAVLMLYFDRATVCISSQVGCAMGCSFCATGQMGFTRNLTTGEILEQVLWFNRWLREHPHKPTVTGDQRPRYLPHDGARSSERLDERHWHAPDRPHANQELKEITAVSNVVFMGMGEPLVNYNNLMRAIHTLNSPLGLGMSARRLTVSTVGIVPAIKRFTNEELAVNLAVSLHAPNDGLRSSIVPMNRFYPLSKLMEACKEYVERSRRRITFEYVMIRGVNDGVEHAEELVRLVRGVLCHINLIPLNPVPGTAMEAPPRESVFAFQKVIEEAGIPATVRIERGVDIAAACGQLKVAEEPNSRRRSLNPELISAHVEANLASSF